MERPGVGPATSVEAAARGEVVLVAEDNVTSQDVIRRQLHMLGYTAEMTSNGAEALATLASGRHGLLLTDCHMPVVDGYELARRVRRAEEGGEGRLPIVAITASVMEDDVRKCLEAGMDDYLAKPIEMDRLRAMLARWLPRAAASGAAAGAGGRRAGAASGAQADGGGGPAIDERALKDVFGDDPEVFREILGDFVGPARANLAEIVAACEARDARAVGDACHKLQSSAKAVGAHELAELCVALEKAGKAADWEAIGRYSPELGGAFAKVAAYIAER